MTWTTGAVQTIFLYHFPHPFSCRTKSAKNVMERERIFLHTFPYFWFHRYFFLPREISSGKSTHLVSVSWKQHILSFFAAGFFWFKTGTRKRGYRQQLSHFEVFFCKMEKYLFSSLLFFLFFQVIYKKISTRNEYGILLVSFPVGEWQLLQLLRGVGIFGWCVWWGDVQFCSFLHFTPSFPLFPTTSFPLLLLPLHAEAHLNFLFISQISWISNSLVKGVLHQRKYLSTSSQQAIELDSSLAIHAASYFSPYFIIIHTFAFVA